MPARERFWHSIHPFFRLGYRAIGEYRRAFFGKNRQLAMQPLAAQKKTCPRCRKTVPRIHTTCEFCGYDLTSQIPPSVTDREYLAKDTWTQPNDDEASATSSIGRGAPPGSTSLGYEGRRPAEATFKHTIDISSSRALVNREINHLGPMASTVRRPSSPPSSGLIEDVSQAVKPPAGSSTGGFELPDPRTDFKDSAEAPSDALPAESTGSLRLGMGTEKSSLPPVPNSLNSLAVTSVVLMAAWLLPDIWRDGLVFPISKLDTLERPDLFAALLRPMVGALCLGLVALPIKTKLRCIAATPLLMAALGLPIMINPLGASAESGIAVALSAFSIPTALVAFVTLKTRWGGHATLMLIPASMFVLVFHGISSGDIPPSLIAAYKAPFELWALTLGITACIGSLSMTSRQSPRAGDFNSR